MKLTLHPQDAWMLSARFPSQNLLDVDERGPYRATYVDPRIGVVHLSLYRGRVKRSWRTWRKK